MESLGESVPDYVRPALWCVNLENLNLERDASVIIFQVLNFGSHAACQWLISRYDRSRIQDLIRGSVASSWDSKSLNLWSLVFDVYPIKQNRECI